MYHVYAWWTGFYFSFLGFTAWVFLWAGLWSASLLVGMVSKSLKGGIK